MIMPDIILVINPLLVGICLLGNLAIYDQLIVLHINGYIFNTNTWHIYQNGKVVRRFINIRQRKVPIPLSCYYALIRGNLLFFNGWMFFFFHKRYSFLLIFFNYDLLRPRF